MIKINRQSLQLNSETALIPAQGSSNVKVEINNDDTYNDYAIVPYVGWLKNNTMFTCACVYENSSFYIPSGAFARNGIIYISLALVKDNEKLKTQSITFTVSVAPNLEIELKNNDNWDSVVSNLVSNLFKNRFESEIEEILNNAKKLNENTNIFQEKINDAITNMGQYEWTNTSLRFKKGDGTWGNWIDIAGSFAKKTELNAINNAFNSVTDLTKQLFLLMHPVGCIYMSTSSVSPQTTFGGTWIRWGNGRVPVGVDKADTDFNTVEKTGGYKVSDLRALIGATGSNASRLGYYAENPVSAHGTYSINLSANVADSQPANHSTLVLESDGHVPSRLQPYVTCYMWKRTA